MSTMTPAEHYREAQRWLKDADEWFNEADDNENATAAAAIAQVHATLATCPPEHRLHGPSDDIVDGDEVTVVITGALVSGIGDETMFLGLPDVDGFEIRHADHGYRDLPGVRVYRTGSGGDR